MAILLLDTKGLRCPQPILKIAAKSPEMHSGDILEVLGDCDSFEKDVRAWGMRMKKVILSVKDEGNKVLRIQIQF
jgi:tRNA 2-thiouridine synthesizing protein A